MSPCRVCVWMLCSCWNNVPLGMNEFLQPPSKYSVRLPSRFRDTPASYGGNSTTWTSARGACWGWRISVDTDPGSSQSDLPRPWSLIHDVTSWIPRSVIQWRKDSWNGWALGSHCFCWLTLLLLSWTQSIVGRWNKYTQWSHYKVCLLWKFSSKYCTTPLSVLYIKSCLFHIWKFYFS